VTPRSGWVACRRPASVVCVRIGLHLSDFTFPNGPAGLADDLTRIVVAAEDAGFARVSVMDHVWQGWASEELRRLAGLGIQHVQGKLPGVWEPERLRLFAREVPPAAAEL
jgi:hypothetical protein